MTLTPETIDRMARARAALLVKSARAMIEHPEDMEIRKNFAKRAFNWDQLAQAIVRIADRDYDENDTHPTTGVDRPTALQ